MKKIFFVLLVSFPTFIFGQYDSTYYPDKSNPFHFYYYTFHQNGQLKSQGVYNQYGASGIMDSVWTFYDSLGNVIQRDEFLPKEKKLVKKTYFGNGILKSEEEFYDDEVSESGEIPNGKFKYWDETGYLYKIEYYKKGKLVRIKDKTKIRC